jgi:hypothetical protein
MEKTQHKALLSAAADNHSKLCSWFSWVDRTPLPIVRSPAASPIADIENHIVRIAGLGKQAIDARKAGSHCIPKSFN